MKKICVDKKNKFISSRKIIWRKKFLKKIASLGITVGVFAGGLKLLAQSNEKALGHNTPNSSSQTEELLDGNMIPVDDIRELNEHIYVSYDNLTSQNSVYKRYTSMRYKDMQDIKKVVVDLYDDYDYSCLNDFTNVECLYINDFCENNNKLMNIHGSNFQSNLQIHYTFMKDYQNVGINEDTMSFLKDIPSIQLLEIKNRNIDCPSYQSLVKMTIDWQYLASLKNINSLCVNIDAFNVFDFSGLSHLKSLQLEGEPYDVAIWCNNEVLTQLMSSGVEISYERMDDLIEINRKLEQIYTSLAITDEMDNLDKLNSILTYINNNKNIKSEDCDMSDYINYYSGGMLYGFLENEEQLPGNIYAILMALCKRANISSINIYLTPSVWNASEIGMDDINDAISFLSPKESKQTEFLGIVIKYYSEQDIYSVTIKDCTYTSLQYHFIF